MPKKVPSLVWWAGKQGSDTAAWEHGANDNHSTLAGRRAAGMQALAHHKHKDCFPNSLNKGLREGVLASDAQHHRQKRAQQAHTQQNKH